MSISTPIDQSQGESSAQIPQNIAMRRHERWSNWGKTVHCVPDYIFYPSQLEDLIAIVRFAGESNKRIRAVATGHSWSALVPTDDILVNVQKLNAVTLDLADADHPRVTVECGATVLEVNTVLEKAGYALPFNVVLESVRFGGLIATGSHGSGWNHQTLSDLVYSIEIVDAHGALRTFKSGVDSDEVMNAARLNLGMFGLIYRMTLDVQKTWRVHAVDRRIRVEDVIESLAEQVPAHDNMDLFWWPFSDHMWVKTWDRTEAAITAKPRYNPLDRMRSAIDTRLYQQSLELLRYVPRLTPGLTRTTFRFTPSVKDQVLDIVEAVHYRRSIEVTRMGCLEIAFKINPDFSNAKSAIQVVLDRTKAYAKQNRYPINVTMNVRFIHNSNCLLSPARGEGHTCYIEILSRTKQADWEQFSGEVAREWLNLPHALPHWAKEYRYVPGVIDHIKRELGANIERFKQIKSALGVDPEHRFLNQAMREIFL